MSDEQLKKQLIQQLFEDVSEGGYGGQDGSAGKLIFHARVFEEEREVRGVKDLLKVSFQNKDSKDSKDAKDDNDDDDDDDEKPGIKGKWKSRIISLSVRKGTKIRLYKLKQERFGSLSVIKVWGLDELKSLENGELCRANTKKMPKLINIGESVMQVQASVPVDIGLGTSNTHVKLAGTEMDSASQELQISGDDEAVTAIETLPTIDLSLVLSDFNWQASGDAAALEARLFSELQALEAANVHDIIQSESQANIVVNEIEQALSELTQIDDWLSHYTSLLDSMGQDVHQIETQNKGMQVTSTNQQCLLTSVEKLLGSLRISGYTLEVLRNEPLDSPDGVRECESAVQKLMNIINTKLTDMGDMAVIKERKALLQGYANDFAKRLCGYLLETFSKLADFYLQDKARISQKGSLKLYAHESLEQKLFKFQNLLRWLKDIDARAHHELQMAYVKEIIRPYRRETQEFIEILKTQHTQRKITQEEMDFLFSGQGVSVSSAASNAIKSAIRSGTSNLGNTSDRNGPSGGIKQKLESWKPNRKKLGKAFDFSGQSGSHSTGDDGLKESPSKPGLYELGSLKNSSRVGSSASLDLSPEERMTPDEERFNILPAAVGHALLKMVNIMVREQNFIIDFFSIIKSSELSNAASTLQISAEATSSILSVSLQSWQEDLGRPREPVKDPKAQKRIQEMMEGIFEDTREQLLGTIESGLKYDQSFSVGMMVHIEFYTKEYANTSHVFVINLLENLQKRTSAIFEKFVIEQIKAVEDTKVTLRKRGGILPFVKTFPRFVDRMETMLSNWDGIARKTVDKAYSRIIKSIFETLDAVAQQAGNDSKANSEEKDSLNIHILNVENMHHFHAEVRARKVPGLDNFAKQAKVLYDVNLEAYCKVVIRKPLGKLLEFFEGIEGLLKTGPIEEVPYHIQYSKSAVKDIIRKYPGKEVKKGLEALYKRVDKHFTEEEGLLQVVWRGIQEEFTRQLRRYEELIAKCYPEVSVRLDFTMEELLGFFSELAQAH
ncbi:hypothetical protein BATDEDRAFT_91658 [Batrachochytrium dendrobatidis JAM81]|uniref:Uncharacterized protein n=1 Tax=Batrachochytrium dendrobatidis (strain JAM81 / FGSC 10211) TaxID=684364 RepID=F4PBD8_BATDJ|nr:uncharacterized protein BATDEDRAFT_91658 [Batrachochytrium dendrobatidis JAM81]EGF77307.1 hypothetical protein BATDEDRAFT_91658 [Batrachochytrium dendrobatidis JAM81]|eukprot:XP_006682035.1 hypothetical protein BATDEDRAFT_91658 [Batrachochytrium dendrobatidis JAM81]